MKNGLKSNKISHKDYDFHKTFGTFGASLPANLPDEYITDAALWCPNQDLPMMTNTFSVPALPYGCTDYGQAGIASDLVGKLYNPEDLENVTHANALGGYDIRSSLMAAKSLGWIKDFFNIRPVNLDFFDSIRLAQIMGGEEKRSVSIGTPWFPSWEQAALRGESIMPMPTTDELKQAQPGSIFSRLFGKIFGATQLPWHNHKGGGWTTKNGVPYLVDFSWQGTGVGDNGKLYFPREVINTVMGISGTVAFTATNNATPPAQTIDTTFVQWIISNFRELYGLMYSAFN